MEQDQSLTRRQFLAGAAGLLAFSSCRRSFDSVSEISGEIIGASHKLGHLLKSSSFPSPVKTERTTVVIIGGGISGLSAGWKLLRSGVKDFVILDLEAAAGGNSRSGKSPLGSYPWGAHYVPFPSPESRAVSELFRELKIETGRDSNGRPVYDERYVCFAPQERIFINGRWEEGLFPKGGASEGELRQYKQFQEKMAIYRRRPGADGKMGFVIPLGLCSQAPHLLALDKISMAEYLRRNDWTSPRLAWYLDHCCRDDFGTRLADTSAWAGIHYFASRGEGENGQVLTWPEGNDFIAGRLASMMESRLLLSRLAVSVVSSPEGVSVVSLDPVSGTSVRYLCRSAILAVPQFVAERIAPALAERSLAKSFRHTPWVVANVTVDEPPSGEGAPPSWDNVIHGDESLGYVSAGHQTLATGRRSDVWTWYLPLDHGDPAAARRKALETTWPQWRDRVLASLGRAHPGIEKKVRRIDVMVWGHGMVRPEPGFVWGAERRRACEPVGAIFPAHSDLSGFSLFEEAQYRGVLAAQKAMARLNHPFRASV